MDAMYFPAGAAEYYPSGQATAGMPQRAPNFNSATPLSAWWRDDVGYVGTTGARFVRDLQRALGLNGDGNWGPATATAMRNRIAAMVGSTPGPVALDVLRNLDQLRNGQSTTISNRTLIAGIHLAYYQTAGFDWNSAMEQGTSAVRLGTNAMLSSVVPPPFRRTAAGNPNVAPQRWPLAGPIPGATTAPTPSGPAPSTPAPRPGTPSAPAPRPSAPPAPSTPAPTDGGLASNISQRWNALTQGQKAAVILGTAGLAGVAVFLATSEDAPKGRPDQRPVNIKMTVRGPGGRLAPPRKA